MKKKLQKNIQKQKNQRLFSLIRQKICTLIFGVHLNRSEEAAFNTRSKEAAFNIRSEDIAFNIRNVCEYVSFTMELVTS